MNFILPQKRPGSSRYGSHGSRRLKTKAAARLIPCTFIGKHLRFRYDDIAEIMKAGERQPITTRQPRPHGGTV